MAKKHPGFKTVQKKIAKKYGMKKAGAILAASTRGASTKVKRANPHLKRVKGQYAVQKCKTKEVHVGSSPRYRTTVDG